MLNKCDLREGDLPSDIFFFPERNMRTVQLTQPAVRPRLPMLSRDRESILMSREKPFAHEQIGVLHWCQDCASLQLVAHVNGECLVCVGCGEYTDQAFAAHVRLEFHRGQRWSPWMGESTPPWLSPRMVKTLLKTEAAKAEVQEILRRSWSPIQVHARPGEVVLSCNYVYHHEYVPAIPDELDVESTEQAWPFDYFLMDYRTRITMAVDGCQMCGWDHPDGLCHWEVYEDASRPGYNRILGPCFVLDLQYCAEYWSRFQWPDPPDFNRSLYVFSDPDAPPMIVHA